ncbi:MAG: hypothetical protein VX189_02510 [Planctomycetota bacterium]|nr:hypothetical protein [Planctomycetota bacterium]
MLQSSRYCFWKSQNGFPAAAVRYRFPTLFLLVWASCWPAVASSQALAQSAMVRLELIMGPGFEPADAHQWLRVLGKSKADDIKIRRVNATDRVEIKNRGTESRPVYVVYGELLGTQTLRVPGSTFRMTQMEGLASWVKELRENGIEGVLEEKLAFGLTSRELLGLHEDLSTRVEDSTQGQETALVVKKLTELISTPVNFSSAAKRAFSKQNRVSEEYQDVSVGTSLAAILRPLGLVAEISKSPDGKTVMQIVGSQDADEFWPIGWPVENNPDQVAPELSERIKVEINDFTLKPTLDAIESKLGLRFFYDQNTLADLGIDLTAVKVSYEHESAPYRNILRRVLSQSRPGMTYEVRMDENDVPFLWITSRARR